MNFPNFPNRTWYNFMINVLPGSMKGDFVDYY